MKNIQLIIAAGMIALLASCSVTVPFAVTNNTIGDKVGVSETNIIFGGAGVNNPGTGIIVTNKKYGVIEAISKGDINSVATVDLRITNFILWQKAELIVTGE